MGLLLGRHAYFGGAFCFSFLVMVLVMGLAICCVLKLGVETGVVDCEAIVDLRIGTLK